MIPWLPPWAIKPLIGAAVVVAAALAFWWWLASHDASLRAAWVAEQTAAVAAAVEEQRRKGDAAAVAAADAARAAALADAPIREVIRRVPVQTACSASPAVAAALRGLRNPSPGPGAGNPAGRVP